MIMDRFQPGNRGKGKTAFSNAASDPRLVEIVKLLARKAAEKDYEMLLRARDASYNPPNPGGQK